MNEQSQARQLLQNSIEQLEQQADVYAKMQQDPMKKLGMAAGAGLLLGLIMGRSSKVKSRTKVVKVPHKKAQSGVGALFMTVVGGILLKTLQEKILAPQIESYADQMLAKMKKKDPHNP